MTDQRHTAADWQHEFDAMLNRDPRWPDDDRDVLAEARALVLALIIDAALIAAALACWIIA